MIYLLKKKQDHWCTCAPNLCPLALLISFWLWRNYSCIQEAGGSIAGISFLFFLSLHAPLCILCDCAPMPAGHAYPSMHASMGEYNCVRSLLSQAGAGEIFRLVSSAETAVCHTANAYGTGMPPCARTVWLLIHTETKIHLLYPMYICTQFVLFFSLLL
jgi:hypothetical protein